MNVIDTATTSDSSANHNQNAGDILASLVGEGKKFKTVEDLALGKLQADQHIPQLQQENAELRNAVKELEGKANAGATLSQVLEALNKAKSPEQGNQPPVSLEELTKLVKSVSAEEREATQRQNNQSLVDQTLVSKFGDTGKAVEVVRAKAKELGLGTAQIKELAQTAPAAFLQLFGATAPPPQSTPPPARGNVNSEALKNLNPDSNTRNNAYYSALRKQMGFHKFYNDFELQRQKHNDQVALGDKF